VPVDVLKFSIDGISRLAFRCRRLLLIVAGGLSMRAAGLVQRTADVQLLRLALTLFGAMAAIRLFVYVLRRALPRSVDQQLRAGDRADDLGARRAVSDWPFDRSRRAA
jgi:hypothetical protein